MVMPKVPKKFCIDEFIYKEYLGGDDRWGDVEYAEPITIKYCRIDRGAEYSQSTAGKQLVYNAVVFCYEGIASPLPKFNTQSLVVCDEQEHTITKVIPSFEAYEKKIYSYELEVV